MIDSNFEFLSFEFPPEVPIKPLWRVTLALICIVLLAGGTVFILFSRRHLAGSDDAELAGWCVVFGLGLSATAAFLAERLFFPKPVSSVAELRFVVLRHEGIDDPHFDLMLETAPGSSLTTWRSPAWPITAPTTLLQLADHRRDYLEFEGKISGNRGFVKRIESGNYRTGRDFEGSKRIEWRQRTSPPLLLRRLDDKHWLATAVDERKN